VTTNEDAAGVSPAVLLDDVSALRRRTRTDRHAYWFPLLLFGVLTLAALPLYVDKSFACPDGEVCAVGSTRGRVALDAIGGSIIAGNAALGWYWLGALLGGGLATVWWYRWHARRRGVQGRVGVAVLAGLVGVAALLVAGLTWFTPYLGVVSGHGTAAFLAIALGLLALAWLERSVGLAVIAVAYSGAALIAMLYDVDNLVYRLGWYPPIHYYAWPNVLLPALVLLVGGGVAALASARSRP
jgi:hypothetical protein